MGQSWGGPRFTIAQLFAPLDGQIFAGENAFQEAVIRCFNAQLHQFPPHYSYLDAITWAMRQNWLAVEGATIRVALPAQVEIDATFLAAAA